MQGQGALRGRRALVTGGSGGIGSACARWLLRDGAGVTLMARREDALEKARKELEPLVPEGMALRTCAGDALVEKDLARALEVACGPDGSLDIAVQTVGGGAPRPLLLHDGESFAEELARNVLPVVLLIRLVAPRMARAGGGSIVCISSDAAKLVFPWLSGYCAGKAALEMLVRCAAEELGAANVRVNAVRPGLTRTDSTRRLFSDPEIHRRFLAEKPLGRTGEPDDIAAGVRYLAGPESGWVTGQSFAIEGGNELRRGPDMEPLVRRIYGDEVVDAVRRGLRPDAS